MKKSYYAVYDYGQGGLWMEFLSESKEKIEKKYPFLTVVYQPPSTFSWNDVKDWCNGKCFDIDSEPADFLKRLEKEASQSK